MAKKSTPIYMTEEQHIELKRLQKKKYPHLTFSGMIVDIVVREARRENK